MESWDFDNVKAEKATAMRRFNRLRTIAKLFRFAEFFAGLVFLSWTFTRVPFALTISRDYFRLLSGIVSSPPFVFVLCNVIIASLVFKSREVTAADHNNHNVDAVEAKLYEEFMENSGDGDGEKSQSPNDVVPNVKEEVVYQDKEIVSEVNSVDPKADTNSDSDVDEVTDTEFTKVIRRTRSEKFEVERKPAKLRRSETEICGKVVMSGEECATEDLAPADDLSNEEFQRTIEAFIEKQKKFRHQESLSIVLQN